ncbi:hypothetical protein [Candidatus Nitrosocosmicus arcticus]|uniref:hypothetical protein n=1 Tax=Candidatus Nitrosocosmicus arcticus TaxID=2035267 RepID=UPI00164425EC|nr:hypothetical protein [Candidatus Nitrosocosmicus arcticus]
MNKLYVFLISTVLTSSILFAMPVISTSQGQIPTSDLPMTIINETNSSGNTAEDAQCL